MFQTEPCKRKGQIRSFGGGSRSFETQVSSFEGQVFGSEPGPRKTNSLKEQAGMPRYGGCARLGPSRTGAGPHGSCNHEKEKEPSWLTE